MYIKALGSGEWGTQHNMRCQSWAGCKVEQAANWALGQKWWHFLLHPRYHPLSMSGPTFVEGNLKNLPRSWAPALLLSAHLPSLPQAQLPTHLGSPVLVLSSQTLLRNHGSQWSTIWLDRACYPLHAPGHSFASSLLPWPHSTFTAFLGHLPQPPTPTA